MARDAIAFIFCRGGSKGLPGKNIRLLDGKPLLAYSIETAIACPSIRRVIVSTDSVEIAEVARTWGAEVPFLRPSSLADDNSNEWLAWRHAVEFLRDQGDIPECFVSLPATSPLRSREDVEACISALDESVDIVVTATPSRSNPWYSMIIRDEQGLSKRVIQSEFTRRQDAPAVYDLTGVAFVTTPTYILTAEGVYSGRVKSQIIPSERAVDIDDLHDFRIAEAILNMNNKDTKKN